MINRALLLFIGLLFFHSQYCIADYWTQKADLPSQGRDAAISFCLGNYGYAGTGYGTFDDLWQYDPLSNNWVSKAVMPNQPRYGAVAAACLGKGYAGLGQYLGFKNDWWEYDPSLDMWTQKSSFPGSPREYASSFCIDSIVYVGCGLDSIGPQRDWWKYNPGSNSWGVMDSIPLPGSGSFLCVSFSLLGKGYVIPGYFGGHSVYEYDPILQVWNTKNPFPGTGRYAATGFTIGAYGYIGTGDTGYMTPHVKDFWQYDPYTDQWYQKNDFSGIARISAIGFSIGTNGYLGFGASGAIRLNDFWEYTPDSITSTLEILKHESVNLLFPNPTTGKFTIQNAGLEIDGIVIYSLLGEKVMSTKLQPEFDISGLPSGVYIVKASNNQKTWQGKVVKE